MPRASLRSIPLHIADKGRACDGSLVAPAGCPRCDSPPEASRASRSPRSSRALSRRRTASALKPRIEVRPRLCTLATRGPSPSMTQIDVNDTSKPTTSLTLHSFQFEGTEANIAPITRALCLRKWLPSNATIFPAAMRLSARAVPEALVLAPANPRAHDGFRVRGNGGQRRPLQ